MARRCVCSKLLDQLRTDPRLRALPLAARAVWLEIVAGLVAFAPTGRIRLPNSVPESVARWVGGSVTEIETHLQTLAGLGLVAIDDDGQGLSVPEIVAAAKRSEINRINGLKGGAPRKHRPPDPRQGEMKHVIPGGRAEAEKTEPEPNVSRARVDDERDQKKRSSSPPPWIPVAVKVADALGLSETARWNLRPVAQWLADGADEAMLLDIAREVRGRTEAEIGSVNYMGRAVTQALAERKAAAPTPGFQDLMAARQRWVEGGMVGPSPLLAARAA